MAKVMRAVIALCVCILPVVVCAGNEPFDFNYSVLGTLKVKPSLIFNDGKNTFIEVGSEEIEQWKVIADTYSKQGPYLVIHGIPSSFAIVHGKADQLTVTHTAIADGVQMAKNDASVPKLSSTEDFESKRLEPITHDSHKGDRDLLKSLRHEPAVEKNIQQNPVAYKEYKPKSCFNADYSASKQYFLTFQDKKNLLSEKTEKAFIASIYSIKTEKSQFSIESAAAEIASTRIARENYFGRLFKGISTNVAYHTSDKVSPGHVVVGVENNNNGNCLDTTYITVNPLTKTLNVKAINVDVESLLAEYSTIYKLHFVHANTSNLKQVRVSIEGTYSQQREILQAISNQVEGKADIVLTDSSVEIQYH